MTEPVDAGPTPTPSAMTAWRPPLVLKVIAAWEIAAGVVLAGLILWSIAHGAKLHWTIQLAFEAVVAASILAGVTLWRGEPPGFFASCILQLLQVVRIFTRPFTFALLLGPSLTLWEFTGQGPRISAELRAAFALYFGKPPDGFVSGFAINVMAIAVLIVLIRLQAVSGQPWLHPRARGPAWDRAQLIGAYQIGAGGLGVMNSTAAPTHAMANLLFSIVVIGSGVALVRRARWSDGVAVAVNAMQIPAFATTDWTYLVRSGVSCVAAVVWGGESGLHVQFDVGSVINAALAPRIEGFVGINVTAFALTAVLASYQPGTPTRSSHQGRWFLPRQP